jgi:predicted nucleic acid-binding protein
LTFRCDEFIARAAALTSIANLRFLPTTAEVDLLALTLMRQHGLESIFDAYHAATAINQVKDHTIFSTDHVFDRIPWLIRVDPGTLVM